MFSVNSSPAIQESPVNFCLVCPTSEAVNAFHDPYTRFRSVSVPGSGNPYEATTACDASKPAVR